MLAELQDERFDPRAIHHEIEALDRAGTTIERQFNAPDQLLAWIDAEFGGTWSSEVARGSVWYARDREGFAGFAAYDVRGLRYRWLRPYAGRPDVGVFGPIGVASRARNRGIGKLLLRAAMFGLAERQYARAVIPAVGDPSLVDFYARNAGAAIDERAPVAGSGRRWRATVMASSYGGNFQAVIDAVEAGTLPLELCGLICNNEDGYALVRARKHAIPAIATVWERKRESRADFDARLSLEVDKTAPDVVLLLGWMHLLPGSFVERFECLNLHPAFLPLDPTQDEVTYPDGSVGRVFRGAHAIEDALGAGSAWVGVSVHRATALTDRGEVYARFPLALAAGEGRDALETRVHYLEHRVVHTAIRRWTWEQPD